MRTIASSPVGQLCEVAGRRLLLHRAGGGSPSVVFLSGAGAVGLDYLIVQRLTAELTTSILYDRAGTGWSERIRLPRTARQVTDELRALLRTAGVPSPYILVGHSLGGLYARHYAQRFPDDMAGLLLMDPAHEDYDAYMPGPHGEALRSPSALIKKQLGRLMVFVMTCALRSAIARSVIAHVPIVRRYRDLYRRLFEREMADWPRDIRDMLVERHVSLEWLWTGVKESLNVNELYDEVRRAGPLPNIPLIVLCSMAVDDFRRAVAPGESEVQLREQVEGKQRLYASLAASVARGESRPVDGGHYTMHLRHPEAVIRAIEDLIKRAHSPQMFDFPTGIVIDEPPKSVPTG